jgi:hypothetical protein
MLRIYDPVSDLLDYEEVSRWNRVPLRYLAGCLQEDLGYKDEAELQQALSRTFDVCCLMHIPIRDHFRQVWVCDRNGLRTDWQLSDLGLYLLLVNGNSCNPHVARAQLFLLGKLAAGRAVNR